MGLLASLCPGPSVIEFNQAERGTSLGFYYKKTVTESSRFRLKFVLKMGNSGRVDTSKVKGGKSGKFDRRSMISMNKSHEAVKSASMELQVLLSQPRRRRRRASSEAEADPTGTEAEADPAGTEAEADPTETEAAAERARARAQAQAQATAE